MNFPDQGSINVPSEQTYSEDQKSFGWLFYIFLLQSNLINYWFDMGLSITIRVKRSINLSDAFGSTLVKSSRNKKDELFQVIRVLNK